jgi:hypothetical protein
MNKLTGHQLRLCNLRKGGSPEQTIFKIPEKFLMWIWFDKYIVRHEKMDTFSGLNDIFSVPGIKTLFQKSSKFRYDENFRPTVDQYFKMCFKSSSFKLKCENGMVSVINKANDIDKLKKDLKGFFARLHKNQADLFKQFKYHSLVEGVDKVSYAMYGPLSYANHSCSAIIRILPPTSAVLRKCKKHFVYEIEDAELDVPFFPDCLNAGIMPQDKCGHLRSIVVGNENDLDLTDKLLEKERKVAEKNDWNPFGKKYSSNGISFINTCDQVAIKGEEFFIRYANYIPRNWFECSCEPKENCCQYDFRYVKRECAEPCLKRSRRF